MIQSTLPIVLGFFFVSIIFTIDLFTPLGVAVGTTYSLVILYTWLLPGRSTIYFTILCCILLILGWAQSDSMDGAGSWAGLNRISSLVVILAASFLVKIAKQSYQELELIRDSLEEQVKQRTEELKISEERARLMTEEISDYAIFLMNPLGRLETWNYGAQYLFGYTQKEILGKPFDLVFVKKDRQNQMPKQILEESIKHGTYQYEGWLFRNDNTTFWARMSVTVIHDRNEITGYTVVISDLTDQRAAVLEAKNRELEQFAYVVAHDLKAPLGSMATMIEFYKREYSEQLGKEESVYLESILKASNRMIGTVSQLLKFSIVGRDTKLTEVDCNALLEEVQSDLSPAIVKSGAILQVGNLPVVMGYPTELRLLFQNLISNAIKFTKKNSTPEIVISADQQNEYWKFSIKDNGIGIDKENFDKIFKPFHRLHSTEEYEGMGIGLSHCEKILKLHGGFIEVESKPAVGSTFSFWIPIQIIKKQTAKLQYTS